MKLIDVHALGEVADGNDMFFTDKLIANGTPLDNNYTVSNEYVDYQDRVGADMRGKHKGD